MEQRSKIWRWVLLLGLIALGAFTVLSAPKEAHQDKCRDAYGAPDWDVIHSLPGDGVSAIQKTPCDEQHSLLDYLANIPKEDREEVLDRIIQNRERFQQPQQGSVE
jgi:hypothetical protein